jgi:hypothetical protein
VSAEAVVMKPRGVGGDPWAAQRIETLWRVVLDRHVAPAWRGPGVALWYVRTR